MIFNIICSIGNDKRIGGQIAKTKEIINFIEEHNHQVIISDLHNVKRNPVMAVSRIIKGMKKADSIILVVSNGGYKFVLPVVYFFNYLSKKPVYEFVIGGTRHHYLKKYKWLEKMGKGLAQIYVETPIMKNGYLALGFDNVKYVPNFKSFSVVNNKKVEGLKICALSRIDCRKGMDIVIQIGNELHKKYWNDIQIDIYGPIEKECQKEFDKWMKTAESNINYCGAVLYENVQKTLSGYDIYLFPTKWESEGFPGTMIDALSVGAVVLANYRENFVGIVKDNYNGWLVHDNKVDVYVEKIEYLLHNPDVLQQMKEKCRQEADKYKTQNVLGELLREWEDNFIGK